MKPIYIIAALFLFMGKCYERGCSEEAHYLFTFYNNSTEAILVRVGTDFVCDGKASSYYKLQRIESGNNYIFNIIGWESINDVFKTDGEIRVRVYPYDEIYYKLQVPLYDHSFTKEELKAINKKIYFPPEETDEEDEEHTDMSVNCSLQSAS